MVNLVMMFIVGMAIGQGGPVKNDVDLGNDQFAVDQRGKFVVYRTEALPSEVNVSVLHGRLTAFLETKGNRTAIKNNDRLESEGSIPMERHVGLGNYVAGEINYTLVVENNQGELNYWFTDLTYQPYRNDRYGKRVRATVTPIPLEKQFSKVNEHVWQKQRKYAYEAIDTFAEHVLGQLEAVGKPKVITTNMD